MPPTVFLSYCHADEAWKARLVKHLAGLERDGRLRVWNDRLIRAGQTWLPEIETAMGEARVAVLLVSPDFLASTFITDARGPSPPGAPRAGGSPRRAGDREGLPVGGGGPHLGAPGPAARWPGAGVVPRCEAKYRAEEDRQRDP